ncbi:MAG: CHASE3 domain-containing protein [Methylococcaceae bacterium]|nr:CHASE3 domain-containing protein [Methylococcaceae bacterium]
MKTNNKLVFSIAGALLLVALIALIVAASFWAFKQSETALEARRHTSDLILRANALMSELKDAETGQRGYLLTGDEAFLEPYLMVRDHIIGDLDQLRLLNSIPAANKPLNALVPLVDAKMTELAEVIELRRKHDMAAVLALLSHGDGQQLMTSIRAQMSAFNDIKQTELAKHEATLLQKMKNLFVIIVFASLLTLLFALSLPYFIYRESQQRIKNLLHIETQHLLELQEQTNKKLQQTNVNLEISEEKLAVTLNSIGDAVIATDAEARVTVLNAVAAKLTGWTQAEATGRPVAVIFHIINKHNREPITIPVMAT